MVKEDIITLLQEIRRNPDKTPSEKSSVDGVEKKVQELLPSLFECYLNPKQNPKEKELVAVLRLLKHMMLKIAGYLKEVQVSALFDSISYILQHMCNVALRHRFPLFAEVLVSILISLKERGVFPMNMVCEDLCETLQDLSEVISLLTDCQRQEVHGTFSLVVFLSTFEGASKKVLNEEIKSFTDVSWNGIVLHLHSAESILSLTDGIVQIFKEIIIHSNSQNDLKVLKFMSRLVKLLAIGDPILQCTCFTALGATLEGAKNSFQFPLQGILATIFSKLSASEQAPYRTKGYDTGLAGCLKATLRLVEGDINQLLPFPPFQDIPQWIHSAHCKELKVALTDFILMVLQREKVLHMTLMQEIVLGCMDVSEVSTLISECLKIVVCQEIHGESMKSNTWQQLSQITEEGNSSAKHGHPRKRQKQYMEEKFFSEEKFSSLVSSKDLNWQEKYISVISKLKPGNKLQSDIEKSLASLRVCARVFGPFLETPLWNEIAECLNCWLTHVTQTTDLSHLESTMFLEAFEQILAPGTIVPNISTSPQPTKLSWNPQDFLAVLKLPWLGVPDGLSALHQSDSFYKMKTRALRLLGNITDNSLANEVQQVLKLALEDPDYRVRLYLPKILPKLMSTWEVAEHLKIEDKLESLSLDSSEEVVKETVSHFGPMVCSLFSKKGNIPLGSFVISQSGRQSCDCDFSKRMNLNESAHFILMKFILNKCFHFVINTDFQHMALCSLEIILTHFSPDLGEYKKELLTLFKTLPIHPNEGVREAFSSFLKTLLQPSGLSGLKDLDNEETRDGSEFDCSKDDTEAVEESAKLVLLRKIKSHLHSHHNNDFFATLCQLVEHFATIGNVSSKMLSYSVVLLVEFLDKDLMTGTYARHSILSIARIRHPEPSCTDVTAVRELMESFKEELYNYLINRLPSRPHLVKEFAESLLQMNGSRFVLETVPFVLPKLVAKAIHSGDTQESISISLLCKYTCQSIVNLLVENWEAVILYAFLHSNWDELQLMQAFLERNIKFSAKLILRDLLPNILYQVFLKVQTSEKARKRLLPFLHELSKITVGSVDLPEFLSPLILGIFNALDHNLLRSSHTSDKLKALNCLDEILPLIGTQLASFVPKVIALLSFAIKSSNSALTEKCLHSWMNFVKLCSSTSPGSLSSAAPQVVAALLPFANSSCDFSAHGHQSTGTSCVLEVSKFAQEIIQMVLLNSAQDSLDYSNPECLLLPDSIWTTEIFSGSKNTNLTLQRFLPFAVSLLKRQPVNVRVMMIVKLVAVIRGKYHELFELVEMSQSEEISDLVDILLKDCTYPSRSRMHMELQLAAGRCFSSLGAIDPDMVVVVKESKPGQAQERLHGDGLVIHLISEHLAKMMHSTMDNDIQDAASLAVQELLRLKGCSLKSVGKVDSLIAVTQGMKESDVREGGVSDPYESEGKESESKDDETNPKSFWACFSSEVQEIIYPCLSTKYKLRQAAQSTGGGPIYKQNIHHGRWLQLWCRHLISLSQSDDSKYFAACKGIVKFDASIAKYILPLLIWDVVHYGSKEAKDMVVREFLTILKDHEIHLENSSQDEGNASTYKPLPDKDGSGQDMIRQIAFSLLDTLAEWFESERKVSATPSKHRKSTEVQMDKASELFASISKPVLATASLQCRAFSRSLLYYETYVRESWGVFNPASCLSQKLLRKDASFLFQVYGGLDEPDALVGVKNVNQEHGYCQSLFEELIIHEKQGNWAEALGCYEQVLQSGNGNDVEENHSGLLTCLLNIGHFHALMTHVNGLLGNSEHGKQEVLKWSSQGLQAAWRMGQWDQMKRFASIYDDSLGPKYDNRAFDRDLTEGLLAFHFQNINGVQSAVQKARESLRQPLAAAAMESYVQAYPLLVKLHMLQELEDACQLLPHGNAGGEANAIREKIFQNWEERLQLTQASLWTREPILALRRVLFREAGCEQEVARTWLDLAKLCRQEGHFQTAKQAALQAKLHGGLEAYIESSKLLWALGKKHQAVSELQQALVESEPSVAQALGFEHQEFVEKGRGNGTGNISSDMALSGLKNLSQVHAGRGLLLLTNWVQETGQKSKGEVLAMYAKVKELQPQWEKSYFYLAKYCDALFMDARKRHESSGSTTPSQTPEKTRTARQRSKVEPREPKVEWWTYEVDAMLNYAKALRKGPKHLFQALPRLLTLWFDFGSRFPAETNKQPKHLQMDHKRAVDIIHAVVTQLGSYQWLTVLPQLVSRICHHSAWVLQLLRAILGEVLLRYPKQALWSMAAVSKSSVPARQAAANDVIARARNAAKSEEEKTIFTQFGTFIDQVMKLCFHQGSGPQAKSRTMSISAEFGPLKRMMPVPVAMPILDALSVTLPANLGNVSQKYNPFAGVDQVCIAGIRDEVEVLASLQRPKKVTFLGTDGKEYIFLCKPKDDLRKDARMMEFTTVLNRLLSKDRASRTRKLYIRTFSVLPLAEDCGMVEWVPNTTGFRHVLQDLYRIAGKFDNRTNGSIKKIHDQANSQGMPPGQMLRTKLLPLFPPIFHKWFLNSFPEPTSWLQSRTTFTRTSAVWSMVGHMVGLGDRHGENILLDSKTGDCVHVDFSCLFDKGLTLEKPEVVPFRLTQNMIDGFGVTGYEGMFTSAAEVTLSVLRHNRETLMSILETFIHDPLVEWTKSHKSSGSEIQNPHAERALSTIEARLQGAIVGVAATPSLPFSVEGQARRLIEEATSHDNLGRMYIWWMPWF